MSRYIDADKLLDRLSAYDTSDTTDKALYNFAHNQVITMPTADVKPVIRGKWERGYSFPDGEYVKCTVCGEIIKCIYPMHFCPNCGADMRGGKE